MSNGKSVFCQPKERCCQDESGKCPMCCHNPCFHAARFTSQLDGKASDRVPGQRKPITLTRTCRPNNTTLGREIGALFQPHDSPLQILTVAYLWKADAVFVSVEQGSPCLPEVWAAWPDCAEAKWVITQPIPMWGGDFRCSCMVDPVCLGKNNQGDSIRDVGDLEAGRFPTRQTSRVV
ncbi:hypothetical protein BJX66DRAFT_38531 [Aspergillus keveii]|uniref:Uncharacterized protein n=1 Tax=Aspergillus keveii TaxID=714993 RepID=A0ABR4FSC4_9EURO